MRPCASATRPSSEARAIWLRGQPNGSSAVTVSSASRSASGVPSSEQKLGPVRVDERDDAAETRLVRLVPAGQEQFARLGRLLPLEIQVAEERLQVAADAERLAAVPEQRDRVAKRRIGGLVEPDRDVQLRKERERPREVVAAASLAERLRTANEELLRRPEVTEIELRDADAHVEPRLLERAPRSVDVLVQRAALQQLVRLLERVAAALQVDAVELVTELEQDRELVDLVARFPRDRERLLVRADRIVEAPVRGEDEAGRITRVRAQRRHRPSRRRHALPPRRAR